LNIIIAKSILTEMNIKNKTETETGDNIFSLHQSIKQERKVYLRVDCPSKDLPKYFDWREPNKVFFIRIRIGIMTVDVTLIVTIILQKCHTLMSGSSIGKPIFVIFH